MLAKIAPKTSFGYQILLDSLTEPEDATARAILQALPADLRAAGSLDALSLILQQAGAGAALGMRTHALHALAFRLCTTHKTATDALRWLSARDPVMAVWCALACAREYSLPKPSKAYTDMAAVIERWCHGPRKVKRIKTLITKLSLEADKAASIADENAIVALIHVARTVLHPEYAAYVAHNIGDKDLLVTVGESLQKFPVQS